MRSRSWRSCKWATHWSLSLLAFQLISGPTCNSSLSSLSWVLSTAWLIHCNPVCLLAIFVFLGQGTLPVSFLLLSSCQGILVIPTTSLRCLSASLWCQRGGKKNRDVQKVQQEVQSVKERQITSVIYTSGKNSLPGFWVAGHSASVFKGLPHLLLVSFSTKTKCVWSHTCFIPLKFWIWWTNSTNLMQGERSQWYWVLHVPWK